MTFIFGQFRTNQRGHIYDVRWYTVLPLRRRLRSLGYKFLYTEYSTYVRTYVRWFHLFLLRGVRCASVVVWCVLCCCFLWSHEESHITARWFVCCPRWFVSAPPPPRWGGLSGLVPQIISCLRIADASARKGDLEASKLAAGGGVLEKILLALPP